MVDFDIEQAIAVNNLDNGKVLCGKVGSGKSRVSLVYFLTKYCGAKVNLNESDGRYLLDISYEQPIDKPLYIITTAKKRDDGEWLKECSSLGMDEDLNSITVDSWNNISKYINVSGGMFIFDEQRLVGSGTWVKSFYKIAKSNNWILLSATVGDTWSDYIPLFVANGFYKNKSQFLREHAVYNRYSKWPKIDKYIEENRLIRLRDSLLVGIRVTAKTTRHVEYLKHDYNRDDFQKLFKDRWNIYDDAPVESVSELCYLLRKVSNSSEEKLKILDNLVSKHQKLIIFYNFDYELDILRQFCDSRGLFFTEWNGHKHESIDYSKDQWVYLVQYTSGCEGWNCVETNTIVFFSQSYSYRQTEQAMGRIDRRNTKFTDLYYFFLISESWMDKSIRKALKNKKNFNERSIKW